MTTDNVTQLPATALPEVREPALYELTPEEIASFQRQNPAPAHSLGMHVAYDNGIPADGLNGVGL